MPGAWASCPRNLLERPFRASLRGDRQFPRAAPWADLDCPFGAWQGTWVGAWQSAWVGRVAGFVGAPFQGFADRGSTVSQGCTLGWLGLPRWGMVRYMGWCMAKCMGWCMVRCMGWSRWGSWVHRWFGVAGGARFGYIAEAGIAVWLGECSKPLPHGEFEFGSPPFGVSQWLHPKAECFQSMLPHRWRVFLV